MNVDAETMALLKTMGEAMRLLSGAVSQQKARIQALEDLFLALQKKGGEDVEKLREHLDRLQEAHEKDFLLRLGDKNPEAAADLDTQGLLSKLLDDLESPDDRP